MTTADDEKDIPAETVAFTSNQTAAPRPARHVSALPPYHWQQQSDVTAAAPVSTLPPYHWQQKLDATAATPASTLPPYHWQQKADVVDAPPLPPGMEKITETFNIILQKGIEGGISFLTAKVRYLITRAPRSGKFLLSFHERRRPDGDLDLIVNRELKVCDYVKSILRFQEIIREIPIQYIGAEDLYCRDTSIVHVDDATKLWDLHKSGPEAAEGIPHPTEEQKVLFDEAVSIVEKWGNPRGPGE